MTTATTTREMSRPDTGHDDLEQRIIPYHLHSTIPSFPRQLVSSSLIARTIVRWRRINTINCIKIATASIIGLLGVIATWWALELAMWTAVKEYRDDCRQQVSATITMLSTPPVTSECQQSLEQELRPPTMWRSFLHTAKTRGGNLGRRWDSLFGPSYSMISKDSDQSIHLQDSRKLLGSMGARKLDQNDIWEQFSVDKPFWGVLGRHPSVRSRTESTAPFQSRTSSQPRSDFSLEALYNTTEAVNATTTEVFHSSTSALCTSYSTTFSPCAREDIRCQGDPVIMHGGMPDHESFYDSFTCKELWYWEELHQQCYDLDAGKYTSTSRLSNTEYGYGPFWRMTSDIWMGVLLVLAVECIWSGWRQKRMTGQQRRLGEKVKVM